MKLVVISYRLFLGLVAFLLASCFSTESLVEIVVGEVPFRVEIASTPEQHRRGLMFRTSLDDGHGMLFVFEKKKIGNQMYEYQGV